MNLTDDAADPTEACVATIVTASLDSSVRQALLDSYRADPAWQRQIDYLTNTQPAPIKGADRVRYERLRLDNATGLLYYRLSSEHDEKLVVPKGQVRDLIMTEHHSSPASGHLGFRRQKAQMSSRYWWPGLATDLHRYCRSCLGCQRAKASNRSVRAPLQPLAVPRVPWTHVTMDFLSGFKPRPEGDG